MIIGINTSYSHRGQEYHIQCEDLGNDSACFEIKLYKEGAILWQKRVPHAPGAAERNDPDKKNQVLRRQMEKLVQTLKIAITQNKIGMG